MSALSEGLFLWERWFHRDATHQIMAAHLVNIFYYNCRKCSLSDEYKSGRALA